MEKQKQDEKEFNPNKFKKVLELIANIFMAISNAFSNFFSSKKRKEKKSTT